MHHDSEGKIPHMLVCASPENCQDDKKKMNSKDGGKQRQGDYPPKLAARAKRE